MDLLFYNSAKNNLLSGDFSDTVFFKENDCFLEFAYSLLLSGDISGAKDEFKKLSEFDFRANWAVKLIGIIEKKIRNIPSYFQVRNFLEIDLNLLLIAKQPEYVENIINTADFLYGINQESYKFISRVMYNNGFENVALYYLIKAKNKFYNDPEMHYLLASCYIKLNEIELAKKSLSSCLKIIPNYTPAQNLQKSLTNI